MLYQEKSGNPVLELWKPMSQKLQPKKETLVVGTDLVEENPAC
jgi:hypothetical protein